MISNEVVPANSTFEMDVPGIELAGISRFPANASGDVRVAKFCMAAADEAVSMEDTTDIFVSIKGNKNSSSNKSFNEDSHSELILAILGSVSGYFVFAESSHCELLGSQCEFASGSCSWIGK